MVLQGAWSKMIHRSAVLSLLIKFNLWSSKLIYRETEQQRCQNLETPNKIWVKVGKSPNDLPETYRNVAKNNGNRRSTTLADGNCRIGSFGPDFRGVHGLQYTNLGRNLTKPFEERLFNMVKPCTFHHARQTWTFEMNPARVIALASRNKKRFEL